MTESQPLEPGSIIDDLVPATILMGAVGSALAGWIAGWWMAVSVWGGAAACVGNLLALRWLVREMTGAAVEGDASTWFWGAILGLKMFALMLLTVLAVLVVGASPFGFVIGYSLFLPAIGWRVAAGRISAPRDDGPSTHSD